MMDVRAPDGRTLAIDDAAFGAFTAALRGQCLRQGDAGYDAARAIWNGMFDRRPAFIVRALGTSDVVAFVNFVRERGIAFAVKSGGHNVAGLAAIDDGALIDLSLMRGVWVDRAARSAHVQGGALLGDVDRETQMHGLAAVMGFISETGVAGLTLGGGFGYLTRRFGWTCDTLKSVDVVLADGRIVHATRKENPDLFWAVRGGGGNFGIVVGFEFALFPVGPEIVGGAMAWPAHAAPQVLDVFRSVTAKAPRELACVAGLRKAPPAPWLDSSVHGRDIVLVAACHTGELDQAERDLAPFKQIKDAAGDVLQRRSYVSQQSLLDATQPKGRRYYWKSDFVSSFQPDLLTAARIDAESVPSPHSAVLFFPVGGALNDADADESPAGNRDATGLFNVAGAWDSPADDEKNIAWVRDTWKDLSRFSTGGAYINFQTEDEDASRVRAAYGSHLTRLAHVKSIWDPHNLFRTNKNIAPGA